MAWLIITRSDSDANGGNDFDTSISIAILISVLMCTDSIRHLSESHTVLLGIFLSRFSNLVFLYFVDTLSLYNLLH